MVFRYKFSIKGGRLTSLLIIPQLAHLQELRTEIILIENQLEAINCIVLISMWKSLPKQCFHCRVLADSLGTRWRVPAYAAVGVGAELCK